MTVLDYIYLGLMAAALVLGLWKGFLGQVFAVAGIFVVYIGTGYLTGYPNAWLSGVIADENLRALVALIITVLVLTAIYAVITKLLSKAIKDIKILSWVDKLLGALISIAVVYLLFALPVALVVGTPDGFMSRLKEPFASSWIVNNIYGGAENPQRNFFGNWLLRVLQEKISGLIAAQVPAAPAA